MGLGSTDFPTDLDSNAVADGTTEISSGGFNDHSIQIEAIEAKVGIDSSSVTISHDYKLSGVATGTKAVSLTGTETLTNKTLTTPLIDTINEKTTANGVTIDGLNIKDSKLTTSNSVVTANITDDAVTTVKILDANVTLAKMASEAWTAYTPVWTTDGTAPSLGNGTITGYFTKIGRTVHYRIKLTWGSETTGGTGTFAFTLPVAFASTYTLNDVEVIGAVSMLDFGTRSYVGTARTGGTTAICRITFHHVDPNIVGASYHTFVTDTAPFTMAVNDYVVITGTYESAS